MKEPKRHGSLHDAAEDISSRHPGLVVREFRGRRPGVTAPVEDLRTADDRRRYSWGYDPDGCVRISGPGREFRSILVESGELGAAELRPDARKRALRDLAAVAKTEVAARRGWDREGQMGFTAADLVDVAFGLVEGVPYFFLKFPDARTLAIKSMDLNLLEAEEILAWAKEELGEGSNGAKMGDVQNVPRPEMWSAESVVQA